MSTDPPASEELSQDLVFDILSNTRRRMVLYYLREYGAPASVQEIAERIAALENEIPPEELSRQQQKRVYVSLYQTHLPKLHEAGIIEYDDAEGMVSLTDRALEIDTYLTPTSESTYPWQLHYLVLAAIGGILFVLASLSVSVFAAIPTLPLGIVLMLSFAVSAAIQYWQHTQRQQSLPAELLEGNDR
jgi:DNA-binding transcriptional ArsR family regulator